MKKNNLMWSIIVLIIAVSITGAVVLAKSMNNPDENEILKSKIRDEMNYLDGKISTMLNSLNNITLTNYIVEEREISSQESELNASDAASEQTNSVSKGESESSSSSQEQGGENSSKSSRRIK